MPPLIIWGGAFLLGGAGWGVAKGGEAIGEGIGDGVRTLAIGAAGATALYYFMKASK